MSAPFSRAKALFSIYFIAAIDNCGYAMVFVLFPPLLLDPQYGFLSNHPSLAQKLFSMGALYAAFPIAQWIGAPMIGELADQFGRKKIFFFTISLTLLTYLFTGFALSLKSLGLVFLGRLLTGLFSGNQGLCSASIADLSPDEKQRAKNFSLLTVVWGLSFPVSLLLGGFLSDPSLSKHFSPSLPFYLIAAITLLSLAALIIFYPETYQRKRERFHLDLIRGFENIMEALKIPHLRRTFILMLIWTLGWGYSVTWFGAYCMQKFGVSQEMVTAGLAVQGLFWTFGGACVKPFLLKRFGIMPIAKWSYGIAALLLLISAFMPSFHTFVSIYGLSAVMGSISLSSTYNLISLASSAHTQGKAMGLAQSMMSLGFFLVPILGSLSGAISIDTFYPISALFLILGLALLFKATRHS